MNNSRRLFFLLPLLFSAAALLAQDHPNLTGSWKLNVGKSEMGSAGVTELTVEVDHKDPVLKYLVRGVAGGQRFEQSESFTTDGKPSRDSQGANVRVSWDGPALVVVGTGDDGSMLFLARLTLSSDGKTITRVFTQKDDRDQRHEIYEKQ
jgi:hypothetical protein